ncbi:hypothetical protein [Kiloniella litopenaei]|uniref:hypothetical protein n=1 Tax=Kiloniella litopenaei TaxID=1549748 RepID=UPI003BAB67FF
MPNLVNPLIDQIIADLKAAQPSIALCERKEGRFFEQDIAKKTIKVPAVLIASVGMGRGESRADGAVYRPVVFNALILTKNKRNQGRDELAVALAEFLVDWLPGQRFTSYGHYIKAEDVDGATNLYSPKLLQKSVAAWLVRWTQKITFPAHDPEEFGELNKGYVSQSPKIGQAHENDYKLMVNRGDQS